MAAAAASAAASAVGVAAVGVRRWQAERGAQQHAHARQQPHRRRPADELCHFAPAEWSGFSSSSPQDAAPHPKGERLLVRALLLGYIDSMLEWFADTASGGALDVVCGSLRCVDEQ